MATYSTAIFDLDGTLLETLEDLHLTLNHSLGTFDLGARSFAETRSFVGNGIKTLVHKAVPKGCDEALEQQVFDEFNRHYALHCNDHAHPYEGIPELIAQLREAGCPIAVVSNKSDYAVQDLVNVYFPGAFDAVLGVREGIAKKPARDMVDAALTQMGERAQADAACGRAVYIGDSEVDLATAAAAEMPCISVTWGFRDTEQLVSSGATHLVDSPAELAGALLG